MRCELVQVYLICGYNTYDDGWYFRTSGPPAVDSLFFYLGGSWLLSNVESFIFHSLMEESTLARLYS
jgi:hypothetical protein